MFQNSATIWIEILVLITAIAFVGTLIGIYIYKRVHHLPTGECAMCHKGTKKLLKEYRCYCAKNQK